MAFSSSTQALAARCRNGCGECSIESEGCAVLGRGNIHVFLGRIPQVPHSIVSFAPLLDDKIELSSKLLLCRSRGRNGRAPVCCQFCTVGVCVTKLPEQYTGTGISSRTAEFFRFFFLKKNVTRCLPESLNNSAYPGQRRNYSFLIPQQPARSQDLISNIKFDIKNNYIDE